MPGGRRDVAPDTSREQAFERFGSPSEVCSRCVGRSRFSDIPILFSKTRGPPIYDSPAKAKPGWATYEIGVWRASA